MAAPTSSNPTAIDTERRSRRLRVEDIRRAAREATADAVGVAPRAARWRAERAGVVLTVPSLSSRSLSHARGCACSYDARSRSALTWV